MEFIFIKLYYKTINYNKLFLYITSACSMFCCFFCFFLDFSIYQDKENGEPPKAAGNLTFVTVILKVW